VFKERTKDREKKGIQINKKGTYEVRKMKNKIQKKGTDKKENQKE
jgi:hypothetical protein